MAVKTTNKSGKKETKGEVLHSEEMSVSRDLTEGTEQKPLNGALNNEEAEELEEEQAAASSEAAGGNAAALAAANSGTESASFKNFRHHPDMENFYRFIFENDLRHEALGIIDQIMVEKQVRKQVKASKAQPN